MITDALGPQSPDLLALCDIAALERVIETVCVGSCVLSDVILRRPSKRILPERHHVMRKIADSHCAAPAFVAFGPAKSTERTTSGADLTFAPEFAAIA